MQGTEKVRGDFILKLLDLGKYETVLFLLEFFADNLEEADYSIADRDKSGFEHFNKKWKWLIMGIERIPGTCKKHYLQKLLELSIDQKEWRAVCLIASLFNQVTEGKPIKDLRADSDGSFEQAMIAVLSIIDEQTKSHCCVALIVYSLEFNDFNYWPNYDSDTNLLASAEANEELEDALVSMLARQQSNRDIYNRISRCFYYYVHCNRYENEKLFKVFAKVAVKQRDFRLIEVLIWCSIVNLDYRHRWHCSGHSWFPFPHNWRDEMWFCDDSQRSNWREWWHKRRCLCNSISCKTLNEKLSALINSYPFGSQDLNEIYRWLDRQNYSNYQKNCLLENIKSALMDEEHKPHKETVELEVERVEATGPIQTKALHRMLQELENLKTATKSQKQSWWKEMLILANSTQGGKLFCDQQAVETFCTSLRRQLKSRSDWLRGQAVFSRIAELNILLEDSPNVNQLVSFASEADQQLATDVIVGAVEFASKHQKWSLMEHLIACAPNQYAKIQSYLKAFKFGWRTTDKILDCAATSCKFVGGVCNDEDRKRIVQNLIRRKQWEKSTLRECCCDDNRTFPEAGEHEIVSSLLIKVSEFPLENCHPTRATLSRLAWPHAVWIKDWELIEQLARELPDPQSDARCIELLPAEVKNCQTKTSLILIRLIRDSLQKSKCCSKAACLFGKCGPLDLLLRLLGLVNERHARILKQCHHKAFVGALKGRNKEIVCYIVQSKFKPDFTDPDILHYLANEALHGDFELIDFIFHELSCVEESQEPQGISDADLRRECAGIIAAVLYKSMSEGFVSLASAVIKYANMSYLYKGRLTCLMVAALAGHHELVKQILGSPGTDIDAVDETGQSALAKACVRGHLRVAMTLLGSEANLQLRDRGGRDCLKLAQLYKQRDLLRLLQHRLKLKSTPEQPEILQSPGNLTRGESLSRILSSAGFTRERAKQQQRLADFLETLAGIITKDGRSMTGSYADGWGNSLKQVNGLTAADSDIDWTVIVGSQEEDEDKNMQLVFHLEGSCRCGEAKTKASLMVTHRYSPLQEASRRWQRTLAEFDLLKTHAMRTSAVAVSFTQREFRSCFQQVH
ncbi:hypothetical protein BOX15_Mlig015886g2 [Macrostomum lignano]|uniref:Uncharacterized protein n=1 Tax=Macrostomum lignano TaxID=282301 RepID=A0A267FNH6_9PLAT|nr:hypothetical protein BOX15_Mlig015886g2 [Macrostomum lignano]